MYPSRPTLQLLTWLLLLASLTLAAGCVRAGFRPPGARDGGAGDTPRGDLRPLDLHADMPVNDQFVPDAVPYEPPGVWVTLKPGTFIMGSPLNEPCREAGEIQHQVTLTHTLQIQTTEVTQSQFETLMGFNPASFSKSANSAVEMINFHLAAAYCNALSSKAGLPPCYQCAGVKDKVTCQSPPQYQGQKVYDCDGYRLPTEAEWEYAYRAGTTSAYYNGANDPQSCNGCIPIDPNAAAIAWHSCLASSVKSVAQKTPNDWGLYDMAGNLWEWCHDHTSTFTSQAVVDPVGSTTSTRRVLRGGSWFSPAGELRAAGRVTLLLHLKGGGDGLRCVRRRR